MSDIIQQAIAKANGASTSVIASTRNQATAAITSTVTTVRDKLPELPVDKDPVLVARQAEALAQLKIAEAKEKLLAEKQNAIQLLGDAKSKATKAATTAAISAVSSATGVNADAAIQAASAAKEFLGAPNKQALGTKGIQSLTSGKIPKVKQLASAKIAAALDAAKKAKEAAEEAQATTVANLEKGTKLFKFPITPVIPEIPRPTIPSPPRIPNLPF
jgi:hypothetical protein